MGAPLILGLLVGIAIGLALGPLLRSWLAWREYVEASREAGLAEELLRLMSERDAPGTTSSPEGARPDAS